MRISTVASIAFLSLMTLFSCKQDQISFLEGTWKIENKNQYEVWEKVSLTKLEGHSYKLVHGEKHISETLSIHKENNEIIYTALVSNQNQGKAIRFTLNQRVDSLVSFENLSHDFPKKIQYKKLNEKELQVYVLGENNQGFAYKMTKQ